MLGSARVAFAAALIAWTRPDQGAASTAVLNARRMHDTLRAAVSLYAAELRAAWFLSDEQANFPREKMVLTVGLPSAARWKPKTSSVVGFNFKSLMEAAPGAGVERFAHRVPFFIAPLADGWPLMFAIKAWSRVHDGRFSDDGRCVHFRTEAPVLKKPSNLRHSPCV
jgi:hypothetical protein